MINTLQLTSPPIAGEGLAKAERTLQNCSFPPLTEVTSPTVTTAAAAYYLNRRPQTLRGWASLERFPCGLEVLRVNGRLAWSIAGLRRVLGA